MTYEIIAIGDGQFLYQILNFLALLNSDNMFAQLGLLGAVLGLVFALLQSISTGGKDIPVGQSFIGVMLFIVMFGQTVTVTVEDFYSGRIRTLDNVPFGTAIVGSLISNVGIAITEKFMKASMPASNAVTLPYQYALDALMASRDLTDGDAYNDDSMGRFMRTGEEYMSACALPMYRAAGNKWPNENPNTADDAMLAMKTTNSVFTMRNYMNFSNGGSGLVPCDEGWAALNAYTRTPNFDKSVSTVLRRTLHRDVKGITSVADIYTSVFELLGRSTTDAQKFMKNSVVAHLKQKGMGQAIGKDDVASAVLITTAVNQRNVQFSAEASLWLRMARGIMTFFEGVAYGLAPFAALLIPFGAYGLRIGLRYVAVLLWIFLWTPLLAFVNMFTVDAMSGQLDALQTVGGAPMHSIIGIMDAQYTAMDYIGLSGWMAPTVASLAGFLVFGGLAAFGSLAARVNGADFVNEQMAAPNMVNTGALVDRAAGMTSSPGGGTVATNAFQAEWTDKAVAGQKETASEQVAKKAYAAFTSQLTESVGRGANLLDSADKALSMNSGTTSNLSDTTGRGDLKNASLDHTRGADTGLDATQDNQSGTDGKGVLTAGTPAEGLAGSSAKFVVTYGAGTGTKEGNQAGVSSGVTAKEAESTGIKNDETATKVASLAKGLAEKTITAASLGLSATEGKALTDTATKAWDATKAFTRESSFSQSIDTAKKYTESVGSEKLASSGNLGNVESTAMNLNGEKFDQHMREMQRHNGGADPKYSDPNQQRAAAALLTLSDTMNDPNATPENRYQAADALGGALGMTAPAGSAIGNLAAGSALGADVGEHLTDVTGRTNDARNMTPPVESAADVNAQAQARMDASKGAVSAVNPDANYNQNAGDVAQRGADAMREQKDKAFQSYLGTSNAVLGQASEWKSFVNTAMDSNAGNHSLSEGFSAATRFASIAGMPGAGAAALGAYSDYRNMQAEKTEGGVIGRTLGAEAGIANQIYGQDSDLAKFSIAAGAGPEVRHQMGISDGDFSRATAAIGVKYGVDVATSVARTAELGLEGRPEVQSIARGVADYTGSR